jgi:hypothetical protein
MNRVKIKFVIEIIEYTWLRADAPIARTRNVGLWVLFTEATIVS